MRNWLKSALAVTCVVGIAAAASPAAAAGSDEAPWSPKVFPRKELIDFGTFQQNPLDVPFEVRETERVPTAERIDFHLSLGADFQTVVAHFEDGYEDQSAVASFREAFVPSAGDEPLKVAGVTKVPKGRRFALSHPKMRRHFFIEIREQDGRALLIFENAAFTQKFLGLVPGRAPFRPVDAAPIPLN